ncbi:MAG: hypothetical protein EOP85_23255 [Verrucomicrobiaceae bacterium]|nr:MAG: hypothetical protein EOP85_23255 [Verrucomicrobiaceae bacterium]
MTTPDPVRATNPLEMVAGPLTMLNSGGRPLLAVAVRAKGAPLKTLFSGALKVMVWASSGISL